MNTKYEKDNLRKQKVEEEKDELLQATEDAIGRKRIILSMNILYKPHGNHKTNPELRHKTLPQRKEKQKTTKLKQQKDT